MQILHHIKRVVGMSMLILFLGACAGPSTPVKNGFTVTPEGLTVTPPPVETKPPSTTPTQRPTESPSPTLSATPTPSVTPTMTLPKIEIVDNLWEWTMIAGTSEHVVSPADFNGEILTCQESSSYPQIQLVRVGDEPTRELHQSLSNWDISDAQVGEKQVVIVEYDPAYGDYHLWVYDLESGERTLLEEWGGQPERHQVPMVSLDGHWLAWSTTLDDGRSCIRIRDLGALEEDTQFEAVCSPDDSIRLSWPYLRWPILAYQLEVIETGPGCWTMYTMRLPDGKPRPHEVTKCEGTQGAADESVIVWMETTEQSEDPWSMPVYGEVPDGQVVYLGQGGAGSVVVCSGRAYWTTVCSNCPEELRSWVPGGPVEVIYRSPEVQGEDSFVTTLPRCHGSLVMISRPGGLNNAYGPPDEILIAREPDGSGK